MRRSSTPSTTRSSLATAVITQAITRLGGVGRSHLAARYVQQRADAYDVVGWIHIESAEQLNGLLAGTDSGRILVTSRDRAPDTAVERKRLADALNVLARFSLATVDDDSVSVHRLLQKTVRDDAASRDHQTASLHALAALAETSRRREITRAGFSNTSASRRVPDPPSIWTSRGSTSTHSPTPTMRSLRVSSARRSLVR